MRKLSIKLQKTEYHPGDDVTGVVELECDKPFDSKKTFVSIKGEFFAKASKLALGYQGRPRKDIQHMEQQFIDDTIILAENKRYEEGTHTFDFSFKLSDTGYQLKEESIESSSLFPSYNGKNSFVKYEIDSEIDVSRISSVKAKAPFEVLIPFNGVSKSEIDETIVEKDELLVEIKMNSNVCCAGEPFEVKYNVVTQLEIKKIRFELKHNEITKVKGLTGKSEVDLATTSIIPRHGKWYSVVLSPTKAVQSFVSDNIENQVYLKITVERPRFNWQELTIPILYGPCPDNLKPVIIEEEFKPAREDFLNSCPNCSAEIDIGGLIKPDGTVICSKCFKRFKPDNV